ncbi:25436_t:CDS:1, partial [Gigaspora rosea]
SNSSTVILITSLICNSKLEMLCMHVIKWVTSSGEELHLGMYNMGVFVGC